MGDVVLGAQLLQPVGPPAAGGDDGVLGQDLHGVLAVGDAHAPAQVALQDEVGALVAEDHLHPGVLEVLLNGEYRSWAFSVPRWRMGQSTSLRPAWMARLRISLTSSVLPRPSTWVVGAELQVDLVGVVDGLLGQLLADEGGQVAAHLVAQGELAVGEGAGAGKAGGDVAVGLAVDALLGLGLGAVALFHRLALFHQDDLLPAALFQHFNGSENASRAGAHDYDICLHVKTSIAQKNTRRAVSPPGKTEYMFT